MVIATESTYRRRASSIGRLEHFYPSPFFDIAGQYIPKTMKETFNWCLFYQLTNPIISSITTKLASYPVTDIIYKVENEGISNRYKELFERQFNIRTFLVETNLDRYTYGNSFVTVSFPIKKMLICPVCGHEKHVVKSSYIWESFKFRINCEECDNTVYAKVRDEPIKSAKQIRLIRWNPKHITIKTNEITGREDYYYTIPTILRNQITLGRPSVVEELPQVFIDAVAKKKSVRIDSDKIFHSKRPSASRDHADTGWGSTLILPVLKDAFFLQVLRKSQEAVAMEHIVPMRVMFPQITADGNNPYAHINLKDWQREVMTQIGKWRQDSNHIAVMPLPVGNQVLGGQGKAYLLHQEIRIYSEQIIAGMGVPVGFFYGEAQYTGASVNLRALENEFLSNRRDMKRLIRFIRDKICSFLDLPRIPLDLKPFKMADDLQRAAFNAQMVAQGQLSEKTFLQSQDFNYETEQELIEKETERKNERMKKQLIAQGEAQAETMILQAKAQQKAQEFMPQPPMGPEGAPPGAAPPGQEGQPPQQAAGQPAPAPGDTSAPPPEALGGQSPMDMGVAQQGGQGVDLATQVNSMVQELLTMNQVDRYASLTQLRHENPPLYQAVNQQLNSSVPPGSRMNMPTIVTAG